MLGRKPWRIDKDLRDVALLEEHAPPSRAA